MRATPERRSSGRFRDATWVRAIVPALLLAAYALACAKAATELVYTGAVYLWTCAGILALGSVGLALRRRSAYLFALPFFALTAFTYLVVSVIIAIYLLTEAVWYDWMGFGNTIVAVVGALLFLLVLASLAQTVFFLRNPPAFASPDLAADLRRLAGARRPCDACLVPRLSGLLETLAGAEQVPGRRQ